MYDMPDVDIDFADRTQLLKHVQVRAQDLKMVINTIQVFIFKIFQSFHLKATAQ